MPTIRNARNDILFRFFINKECETIHFRKLVSILTIGFVEKLKCKPSYICMIYYSVIYHLIFSKHRCSCYRFIYDQIR